MTKIICRTQFVHLHISDPTPGPSGTQSETTPGTCHTHSRQNTPEKRSSSATIAGIVENFAICMSNFPSEIWPNIHQIFTLPPYKPASQAAQAIQASYYAKNFKPVAVPELKALLGLRLQMEKCVVKPWYESYFQGAGHTFIAHTPGFREVMERDRFIAL